MKRALGFVLFLSMTPLMALGSVAYLLCDATAYGWRITKEWLDAW